MRTPPKSDRAKQDEQEGDSTESDDSSLSKNNENNNSEPDTASKHSTSGKHLQVDVIDLEEDRNSRHRATRSRQRAKQNIMNLTIFDNIGRKRRKHE